MHAELITPLYSRVLPCMHIGCYILILSVSCLLNPQVQQDNNFTANFGKKTNKKIIRKYFSRQIHPHQD